MSETTRRERVDVDHRVLQAPVEDAHANRNDHLQTRVRHHSPQRLPSHPISAGSKRARTTAQNDDRATWASTPDRHLRALPRRRSCRLPAAARDAPANVRWFGGGRVELLATIAAESRRAGGRVRRCGEFTLS